MRILQLGDDRLVASPIPRCSHLIRLHPGGQAYDRMIVVTERHDGATLHLAGWIGKPLSLSQWYAAKHALFPCALSIEWERLRDDGTFHLVRLALR